MNKHSRGHIFSCVRPIYEWTVSNLDRSMGSKCIFDSLLIMMANIDAFKLSVVVQSPIISSLLGEAPSLAY